MNFVVFGAGALGVYFGGRLIEAGHNVTFLVRENRANQIKQNGLKIFSPNGDYVIDQPKVVKDVTEIHNADLVFFSVKGYHLTGAISSLKELVKKGAYILPVLNGVEHLQILENELKPLVSETNSVKARPVLGGLSFIIATLDEYGHVHHTTPQHKLVFGPLHAIQEGFCEELGETLQKVNIESELSSNVLTALWDKYMFITAFSGVTSAANSSIGVIRDHPDTFQIGVDVLHEMKVLANKHDVSLLEDHVETAVLLLKHIPYDGTSSMHQDKRKGLPMELDHLHGAALRLAKKAGLSLPTVKFIYQVNKPFEKGSQEG